MATYTPTELSELKSEVSLLQGTTKLDRRFTKDIQDNIVTKLTDTLIEYDEDYANIVIISQLALHFAKYGSTEDLKVRGLNLLTLTLDTTEGSQAPKLQNIILDNIITLLTHPQRLPEALLTKAETHIINTLTNSNDTIRLKALLFLVDTKGNPNHNLATLDSKNTSNIKTLTTIATALIHGIKAGPKRYTSIITKSHTIETDSITTLFINYFINGKLGLEHPELTTDYFDTLLELTESLAFWEKPSKRPETDEEKAMDTHIEKTNITGSKLLLRMADYLEKEKKATPDSDLVYHKTLKLIPSITKISIPKLEKPKTKALSSLEN